MTMTAYELNGNGSACRFIDGEAVLINAETSAYYSMNRTGAFVLYELLVSGRQQDEIAHILEDRFGAQSADLNDDVGSTIAQLVGEGLIVAKYEPFIASEIEGADSVDMPPVYEPPTLERHGELEQLILSGE